MHRVAGAAVLALVLVLAGCSGGVGGDPTPTATPAPVPSVSPTATPAEMLAPGITGAGVSNVSALLDAHERALARRSYVRISSLVVSFENGTTYYRQETRITVEATRTLVRSERSGPHVETFGPNMTVRFTVFNDGGAQVTRVVQRDGTVRRFRQVPAAPVDARRVPRVGRRLRLADHRVERADGGYRLLAADPDWDAFDNPAFLASPRAVRFSTLVTDGGRLAESTVFYRATVDGETVRVRQRLRFVQVGDASVTAPSWYAAAQNVTATPA